jgi:hypothetical protein
MMHLLSRLSLVVKQRAVKARGMASDRQRAAIALMTRMKTPRGASAREHAEDLRSGR